MKISRREVIKLGLAGGAVLISPLALSKQAFAQLSPQIQPFQLPFRTPPVLKPVRSDSTTDYYEITMQPIQAEILPRLQTSIWSYNGHFPGPTIRQARNRKSIVRFINTLDIDTSVHLHGMKSLPQYDGYAEDLISPGFYKDYFYPNDWSATFWYHDHAVHHTARNVYMGLAGLYIVEDEDLGLPLPKGEFDIPLIIQDKSFASDGSLVFNDAPGHRGIYGDVMLVNGVPWPQMEVANRMYRFRVLNAGVSRTCQLVLRQVQDGKVSSFNEDFTVIATDAGLMGAPVPNTKALRIGIAERYGFIIDFSKYPIGTQLILMNPASPVNVDSDSRTQWIMRFDVKSQTIDDSSIPNALRFYEEISESDAVQERTFRFERNGGEWKINNQGWNPKTVAYKPNFGDVEIWNLVNPGGGWVHPVHIHLQDFQMLSRNGSPPRSYEKGWKDTFYVGENETVRVITRFNLHPGKYMMHCHNLTHEDYDMMTQFEVMGENAAEPTSSPAKPLPAPELYAS